MTNQPITIFDTTLRDGQQCPGAGMSFDHNLEYAHLAAEAGIHVLEAGFPAASQTDFMIVNTIAQELSGKANAPIIAGLCQMREKQVEITIRALQPALPQRKARLHIYLPVDPQLMEDSLGSHAENTAQLLHDVYQLVKQGSDAGLEVEFSAEGYSRLGKNFDFTTDVFRAAVSGGATILNCPDTIGGACRFQGPNYFVEHMNQHANILRREFPDKRITWSMHCHNDYGLALENTMNGVFLGPATQIEGCINGIGERAGNVALEQCIMYIKNFGMLGNGKQTFSTDINTAKLKPLSDFVSRYMLPRQPHWPITGENAARHTSGGHTNAVIKNPLAYQPFDPREVGNQISLLFGPLSGSNHAKSVIEQFGYHCEENEKTIIAQFIKDFYADRRKGITDHELLQAYLYYRQPIKVTEFGYSKQGNISAIKLKGAFFNHAHGIELSSDVGDTALATLHKAIEKYFPDFVIEHYHSQAATKGIESLCASKITIRNAGKKFFNGTGEDQDIEISALKALVMAVNSAYIYQHYKQLSQEASCE